MKRLSLALLLVLPCLGCGKQEPDAPPSAAQQVIDGATGHTAVRQYLDTKETIKDIDLKHKERLGKIPKE